MEITLKSGRKIGDGHEPYLIAEVGSNWRNLSYGSRLGLEDCMNSIAQARFAGADAVKFQYFTFKDLYGIEGSMPYALPVEWLQKLKEKADAVGIDFMCTAFSPEGYDIVDPYVEIHKVASSECCHLRILQKLRDLGKPVILSTGAKGVEDIGMAVKTLTFQGAGLNTFMKDENDIPVIRLDGVPVILMYCVVSYPASEVDLEHIGFLKTQFNLPVGYSDHSVDTLVIPYSSILHGACVLEKHFTILPNVVTPDHPHSISPDQFKRMVGYIRTKERRPFGPTPQERTAITRYNRRLIATKDIHIGETLLEGENFGIYRSLIDNTRADHPFSIDQYIGRTAKVEIKAGAGIWRNDFEWPM